MIEELNKIASFYYFTGLDDLRKTDPNEFVKYTYIPSKIYDTFSECLDKEIKNIKEDEILFITGSLHFISQVREKYFKK
jgi:folylpolyglutamate synthase/dihydropteroate synthase